MGVSSFLIWYAGTLALETPMACTTPVARYCRKPGRQPAGPHCHFGSRYVITLKVRNGMGLGNLSPFILTNEWSFGYFTVWSGSGQTFSEGVHVHAQILVYVLCFPHIYFVLVYYRRQKAGSIGLANGTGFTFYPPYLEFHPRNSNSYVTRFTSENVPSHFSFRTRLIGQPCPKCSYLLYMVLGFRSNRFRIFYDPSNAKISRRTVSTTPYVFSYVCYSLDDKK
ncbi:hypothetical protein PIB30_057579 [Stylosanthes scabra]|uniref:Uncharacterized protein n=1 Tax=Stylosanthes scabra TaxID=79078 RepID=A0ABU6RK04_9FABA|nr:hypothetical protein [Stylosanthes scabra]